MRDAAKVLRREMEKAKVVDPHCHLRSDKPSADTLADIVLYHHVWIEMVSSGMGQRETTKAGMPHELEDPGMPANERVRRCLPYLGNIRNTTVGMMLRWILEDLYGLKGGLSEKNVEKACRIAEDRGRDRGWIETVLRDRCGIEANITVEPGPPCQERMRRGREWAPFNIVTGKQTPHQVLASMEEEFGREIRSSRDYREYIAAGVRKLKADRLKFLGLWLLPWTGPDRSSDEDADSVLKRAKERKPISQAKAGGFAYFGVCRLLEELRKTRVRTIQVIAGAEVLPPHRSIPCWNGNLTGAIGRIAGQFEDFHFSMSSASDLYTQDLGILAKHIPNISVAGYWWHTLYPHYIRKAIETRLDMVPANKIVAYFSDAYHSEWCYPKLKMVKAIWGEVLAERVERGWLDLDAAVDLVRQAFHDNPARIYGVGSEE